MDDKQLAVKAVLQYPEGLELGTSPDVRRFKMVKEKPADVKGDLFCRLVNRLSTVFPDITGVNYSLYWKDAEGDLVQFSTLEELQIAIDAMSDHVLRVYIIVHFDEIEDTTEAETEGQSDVATETGGKKRVRFARAGRKLRRKIRRRRRAAFSDPRVIPKEYRLGARALIRRLHHSDKDGAEMESPRQGNASLAEMAPEVRAFIQQVHEEWHSKLAKQRPIVVARRMRMKQRTLPPGLEKEHFLWLLRLMGRWHRHHADQCRAMSGWSSGETGGDDSGGEESMLSAVRRRRKRQARKVRLAAQKGEAPLRTAAVVADTKEEEEEEEKETPEQQKAAREFRQAVRTLMRQIHKKDGSQAAASDQDKAALAALKPEVQAFVQKVADDWHKLLAEKTPRKVAKRMRKRKGKNLPEGLQKEHYLWMCRYFKRWHARHAARCPSMSGWSSGEEDDPASDVEKEEEKARKKGKSSSASSSESESEDKKKKKAVPKEFVKAARILVNHLHDRKPKKEEKASEEETTLAALSPDSRAFVQSFAEEWDRKLANGKSPLVVAKRMKGKKRTLPAGVESGHVQFLCRFLSRWHCKHAAFCGHMGSWSSGETGGESETSGDERASLKRRARLAAMLEVSSASEHESTDCVEAACKPVSKEFRAGVRQWLNQQHKNPAAEAGSKKQEKAKDDKEKETALSPEVQQFLQRFADEWHAKLASGSRPRAASREMKAQERSVSLPSRMEREQYIWLCCFMARWHRRHAAKCDVLLSAGETAEVQG